MTRGDIYEVDLGPPQGQEQAGKRPCIIVQIDKLTRNIPTVVIVPITTNVVLRNSPSTLFFTQNTAGLPYDSVVLCHQIRAVDKVRVNERRPYGRLTTQQMREFESILGQTIGIIKI